MKKIRIGKDIALKWAILTNGENLSLEGRDLKLILTSPLNRETDLQFTVEGNVLSTKIDGISQKGVGTYNLTLWENYGKIGQTALDACNAFSLVRTTCEEDDGDESLRTDTVQLSGDIEVLSAKDYNVLENKPLINGVELKGDKTLEELGIQAKGNFATKEEIPTRVSQLNNDSGYISRVPDEYVTETELEQKGYATKQEIPDVEEFVKTSDADKKYQPKGDYLTEIPDEYINSDELSESLKNYATKTDLSGKQDKGDYALKSEIPNISGLATKEELNSKLDTSTYTSEKSNFATKTEINNKADKVSTENVSEDTKEIQPNRYYIFGEKASLTITLAAGEEGKMAEYMFEFTSGTTPTTLNLPESVKWMGDNTIEASKTYQVSIVNNIAVLGGA